MSWTEFETHAIQTASGTMHAAEIPNPEDRPLLDVRVPPMHGMEDPPGRSRPHWRPQNYAVEYDLIGETITLTFPTETKGEVAL